jgi:hypothetical protein
LKSRLYVLCRLTWILVFLAGCGRVSNDLTLRITDEFGSAIPYAQVVLGDEIGDARTASDAGEATWTGLKRDVITLTVYAEGFLSKPILVSLERGHNEAVVALERAPVDWKAKSP